MVASRPIGSWRCPSEEMAHPSSPRFRRISTACKPLAAGQTRTHCYCSNQSRSGCHYPERLLMYKQEYGLRSSGRCAILMHECPMPMVSVTDRNSELASTGSRGEYQYMRSVNVAGMVAVLVCGATALGATPDSENAKMRAIVIHAYGGPDVMKLENVARPEPAADEVLIRVIAASINPVDVAIRKGYLAKLVGK